MEFHRFINLQRLHIVAATPAVCSSSFFWLFQSGVTRSPHGAPWCYRSGSLPPSCGPPPVPSAALSPGLHDVSLPPPRFYLSLGAQPSCACTLLYATTSTSAHTCTHSGTACDLIGYHLRISNSDSTPAIYSRGGSLHTVWHVMTRVAACLCGKGARGTWKKLEVCVLCVCVSVCVELLVQFTRCLLQGFCWWCACVHLFSFYFSFFKRTLEIALIFPWHWSLASTRKMSSSKHFLVQIRLIVFTVSLSYLNTTVNRRLCEGFFSLFGFAVRGIQTFPSECSLSAFAFGTREQSFAALAPRDAFNIRHHPPFVLEHCLQSGLWTIMSYKKFYLEDVFRQAYMWRSFLSLFAARSLLQHISMGRKNTVIWHAVCFRKKQNNNNNKQKKDGGRRDLYRGNQVAATDKLVINWLKSPFLLGELSHLNMLIIKCSLHRQQTGKNTDSWAWGTGEQPVEPTM